jgi:single-strand DNA-binding protein
MNSVNLIGRLTKDPEIRYTGDQKAVAKFTVAIDDGYGDAKKTNFISIVVFGKQAENCERFLAKGKLVGISGKIQTGSYEKDGRKVYTTDIVANNVYFLEWGEKAAKDNDIPEGFSQITEEVPF